MFTGTFLLIFILNVKRFTNRSIPDGIFTTPRFDIIKVCFVFLLTAFQKLIKKVFSPTGRIFIKGLVE